MAATPAPPLVARLTGRASDGGSGGMASNPTAVGAGYASQRLVRMTSVVVEATAIVYTPSGGTKLAAKS